MRTSHRQIRKRILDAKSKISDEEFFSSRAYNGYLTDLAEAATKRYKRPLRVRVVADHDDDTVAFTDYHGIYINACNHITWSLPTRLLRSMSLEGFNAHECGHNLFTDNRIWNVGRFGCFLSVTFNQNVFCSQSRNFCCQSNYIIVGI